METCMLDMSHNLRLIINGFKMLFNKGKHNCRHGEVYSKEMFCNGVKLFFSFYHKKERKKEAAVQELKKTEAGEGVTVNTETDWLQHVF